MPEAITRSANASSAGSIARVDFYANSLGTHTLIGTATTATGGVYNFTWANVPAGSYSLTAVATDSLGTTATSAAVTVTSDQAPSVTLTSPTAGARITSPNSYTLTATAASVTSTIARVDFYNGTTLLGTATVAPYSFTWANVPVGVYSLTAVATDALGTTTASAAVSVTAIANVPPAVSLTSPTNGATVRVPGSFTLTANATSTTSAIAKVDFYASNGTTNTLVGTATTATAGTYSFIWSNVALGSYNITAIAMDTLNATTTSSPVTVTVNTGIAQAYYIYSDQLDTPRQITDTNGNVVWQWDNVDPFGNNPPNENPNGAGTFNFNLRFPGQYYDRETGLHQNYFRDYDPTIGRYKQSDPIGLAGGSFSTYTYVGGNPLSRTDPSGLLSLLLGGGGSLVVGGGAEGSAGVYVTLPWPGTNFDMGVYASGGMGGGYNVGISGQGGFATGDVNDIRGVTTNVNAGGTVGSGTAMFDSQGNLVGGMIGPAADFGASVTYAETGATGLNDFGNWLGGQIYNLINPSPGGPTGSGGAGSTCH